MAQRLDVFSAESPTGYGVGDRIQKVGVVIGCSRENDRITSPSARRARSLLQSSTAAARSDRDQSLDILLARISWMERICFRSAWFADPQRTNSSKAPLADQFGRQGIPLFEVAAHEHRTLRSCIQPRKDPNMREDTPARPTPESVPVPAKTFSNSSIQSTHGASPSANLKTFWMRFSVSPMYLSKIAALLNFTRAASLSAIARAP